MHVGCSFFPDKGKIMALNECLELFFGWAVTKKKKNKYLYEARVTLSYYNQL